MDAQKRARIEAAGFRVLDHPMELFYERDSEQLKAAIQEYQEWEIWVNTHYGVFENGNPEGLLD